RLAADVGATAQTIAAAHNSQTMAASVRVPIFDGGRTSARRIEAQSAVRQREAELAELRGRVEYDVRAALLDLGAADQQVQAARTNVDLAGQQLQQARDRFTAGVAGHLELAPAPGAGAPAAPGHLSPPHPHNPPHAPPP